MTSFSVRFSAQIIPNEFEFDLEGFDLPKLISEKRLTFPKPTAQA